MLAALLCPVAAWGWGDDGHKIVAVIAADNLPAIVKIVQDYFAAKSRTAAEKYFWRNSVAAYKWVKRDPSQPQL